jgi:hypothetical protein
MPKKANMAKRCAAEKKNKDAFNLAMDGECLVGKVEKNFGNSAFQVNLGGSRIVQGLIRGVLKGGMKSAAFISVGAIVFLAECEGSTKNHEILGVVKSRKELKQLKTFGRIPDSILDEVNEDDIFEVEEEEDPTKDMTEEEAISYLKKRAKLGYAAAHGVAPEPPKVAGQARRAVIESADVDDDFIDML